MKDKLKISVMRMVVVSSLLCVGVISGYAASDSAPSEVSQRQNDLEVKGTVTDKKGEPLPGVVIRVVGADISYASVSDVNGEFSIKVPSSKAVLELKSVGYRTQRVSADGNLNVKMVEDIANLNEVVVIGYGTLDKKEVTSAITSIKGSDLMVGVGGADVSGALQGKVGGLIMNNIGSVNSGTTFQLRGMTSINAGRAPLIVIDGFPGGDIRSLTQEDIESIDVLKDASAGAIYGTRAASGVILITTKSGTNTNGKMKFNYSNEFSHRQNYNALEMLSGREYAEHQIGTDYGTDTDWWDEMINHNNFSHKHHFSLQYGTEKAQIFTSVYYENQEGIAIVDSRKDYGGRFNANFKLFDGWLELRPKVDYRQASRNNHYPNFEQALKNNPTRSPYDETSDTGYNIWLNESLDYNTVADAKLYTYEGLDKWFKPELVIKLNIKPVPGLSYMQTFGYESRQWENHTYNPSYSRTSLEDAHTGSAYLNFDKSENITSEGYFSYIHEFNKHTINATVGYSYFEHNREHFDMSNYNFSVDGVKFWDIGNGTGLSDGKASMNSGKDPSEKLFSVFGRVNYSYNDTYMASASLRHEGSSKFAKDNRWANFWALSAGWRMSNEKFMKDISWLDDLKLRVGYGVTGNNNFGSTYMANLLGTDAYWLLPDGEWRMTYGKTQNVNPDLGWEQKKEWNFGIDYSFFEGRLYGKLDYFIRNIDNLLYQVNVPQPPYTQSNQWQNIGKMQIKGWELEIGGIPVKTKDFTWVSNLNLSHNTGKIKTLWGDDTYYTGNDFPAPGSPGTAARIEEGTTIGQFYIWKFAGFDDDGNFLLYDKDDNIIPAEKKTELDKRYIGNYTPTLVASWSNTFTYKNWDLGINMRSWIDFDVYNTLNMYFGIQGMGNNNVLKDAYGKFNEIRGEKQICDYYLEDGTFLKIDAITLGYTLNMSKWTKYINSIRFWGTCGNVCTITGYSGMNPEVNITGWDQGTEKFWSGFYPVVRTWTFGMQFNF
jgi:TonB-linked SusC/RagA family outer membrane protein